jgi:peptide-methionine (R)-S-oxide reductase
MTDYKNMTDEQWRQRLNAKEFRVCREKGTEPAFSGEYYDEKSPGIYVCRCCGEPLFDSSTKYQSGSGWPSFYQPISRGAIDEHTDSSCGMVRVETTCAKCGSHLGHVFEDGPEPTGLRYCINSLSLTLKKN